MNQKIKMATITFSVVYFLISHVFLPKYSSHKDFFLFSKWKLFASGPRLKVNDLTWDNGKTYLLRDYQKQLLNQGRTFLRSLAYNTRKGNHTEVKELLDKYFKRFPQKEPINFHTLNGSLAEHYIFKKKLKVINNVKI
jgi:hypothetical protein